MLHHSSFNVRKVRLIPHDSHALEVELFSLPFRKMQKITFSSFPCSCVGTHTGTKNIANSYMHSHERPRKRENEKMTAQNAQLFLYKTGNAAGITITLVTLAHFSHFKLYLSTAKSGFPMIWILQLKW
jgi:hypothetical protein